MLLNYLKNIDYNIFDLINHTIVNDVFDVIFPVIRNAQTWIPLYILLVFILIQKFKSSAIVYILYILIAFALADSISSQSLKPWISRLRPCHSTTLQVRLLLGNCGGKWSFPSSHASNHMAIALSIVLAGIFTKKWINYIWIFWALIIGFAQIYVGVHYPSDVFGGIIFGTLIAYFNYHFILPFLNKLYNIFTQFR